MNKLETARRALEDAEARRAETARALQDVTDELSTEDIEALNSDFDEAEAEVVARTAVVEREERLQAAIDAAPAPASDPAPKVTDEAPVYAKGNPERSYFADLYNAQKFMDASAMERLRKNDAMTRDELLKRGVGSVELRETGTQAAQGFIPPIWMADEWAELARPGRPVADRMPKLPLPPDGLTAHIPKVSTGLTEAAQEKDGSGVNESVASADLTSTTVDADLVTIAGQTDVDRQVLERSLPGLDMVLFDDLMRAYDAELDRQVLNGLTANAEFLGIANVTGVNTVTDNSGTLGTDLLQDVYKAISQVYSNRFLAPTAIYMHPRRAAWLAATQTDKFPIFQQGSLFHAVGQQDDGLTGTFAGLPVVVDANIPTNLGGSTNQDAVIVLYEPDLRLAEGEIRQATYQEVLSGKLQVRLQLYGFNFFWPHRQPKGISVISGSVLAAPSGF